MAPDFQLKSCRACPSDRTFKMCNSAGKQSVSRVCRGCHAALAVGGLSRGGGGSGGGVQPSGVQTFLLSAPTPRTEAANGMCGISGSRRGCDSRGNCAAACSVGGGSQQYARQLLAATPLPKLTSPKNPSASASTFAHFSFRSFLYTSTYSQACTCRVQL
eukprot:SAG11_NODE_313_length_10878_cov_43.354578_9_plen_160_part_00